jgi:predicted nucleic acid-binding protein
MPSATWTNCGRSGVEIIVPAEKCQSHALDTAPFIYFIEENPTYINIVEPLFREVSKGNLRAFTSHITLIEVLIKPLEEHNDDLIKRYSEILNESDNLFLADVDKEIAMEAAKLRATHKLKIPDAIQLATGLMNGADAFITNDVSFKRVGQIEVIVLNELI